MVCLQQEQQKAFEGQQEVLLRAQKAEEERARSEAALHALQQHNLHLQQQQEAQRLAGLGRDRQQRLPEEQEQQEAQTRHVINRVISHMFTFSCQSLVNCVWLCVWQPKHSCQVKKICFQNANSGAAQCNQHQVL